MELIPIEKVPENSLPIYFCNAVITVTKTIRSKKETFKREVKKVVLKGITIEDLKKRLLKKENVYLSKVELKTSKITGVKIEVLDVVGFGVLD